MKRSSEPSTGRKPPFDLAALAIAPVGVALLFLAQSAAGIPVQALLQFEAALIVFGGTVAAILLTFSPRELVATLRATGNAFRRQGGDAEALSATIMGFATRAHRHGLVSIDADVEELEDPFLREGLMLAVDELSGDTLRDVLAGESAARAADDEAPARLLEAAAGYAPTLGILGAVLGLIQVMRQPAGTAGLSEGIAVAFVATVYGVGIANLVLLPLAGRLRERAGQAARRRELMTVGICSIHSRLHPRVVAQKLRSFGVDPVAALRAQRPVGAPRPAGVASSFAEAGEQVPA